MLLGKPESHAKAKEILAGFAGAFVDREVESKGLDFFDKEKAKHEAHKHVHDAYDEREQRQQRYDQGEERDERYEPRGERYDQRDERYEQRY